MSATILFQGAGLTVFDYRCTASPGDAPYPEAHANHSLSFVREGAFGLRYRGAQYALVPGSLMIGHAGDEYCCVHDHHVCSDSCLSFQFTPECVDTLGIARKAWRGGALPPLPSLMVLGQLGDAAASGHTAIGVEEAGLLLAAQFGALDAGSHDAGGSTTAERARAVRAADWIDAHASEEVDLARAAAQVHLSPFHFLRLFRKVLGVTPHQYLVRARLSRAAALLAEGRSVTDTALDVGFADLSNFVRTFGRAAGMAPGAFQNLARKKRKIFQEKKALDRLR
jgi:AraC family transcriptional regulator